MGLTRDLTVTAWLSLKCRAWVLGNSASLRSAEAAGRSAATKSAQEPEASAWHAVGRHVAEVAALSRVRNALALGVEQVLVDTRLVSASSASTTTPARPNGRDGSSPTAAPPQSNPNTSACKAIAVVANNFGDGIRTDVWVGGTGYLQFWRSGAPRCTMCWNTGRANVSHSSFFLYFFVDVGEFVRHSA